MGSCSRDCRFLSKSPGVSLGAGASESDIVGVSSFSASRELILACLSSPAIIVALN